MAKLLKKLRKSLKRKNKLSLKDLTFLIILHSEEMVEQHIELFAEAIKELKNEKRNNKRF
jgi:hypothetical protein